MRGMKAKALRRLANRMVRHGYRPTVRLNNTKQYICGSANRYAYQGLKGRRDLRLPSPDIRDREREEALWRRIIETQRVRIGKRRARARRRPSRHSP